ncbi:hypothetical protein WA026_010114 [Henosepilachna vigintioctopunctata]|uniref:Uncharacterized protein n=1 Tax=Henosepilachna vigintioctopunctata TaxID=420089 RepID=A0AAW1UHQ8_9CUCU
MKLGDYKASGASAAKKARVESNPVYNELSTSFQILSPTQTVHFNLAEMLTNSSDAEEETVIDSNKSILI